MPARQHQISQIATQKMPFSLFEKAASNWTNPESIQKDTLSLPAFDFQLSAVDSSCQRFAPTPEQTSQDARLQHIATLSFSLIWMHHFSHSTSLEMYNTYTQHTLHRCRWHLLSLVQLSHLTPGCMEERRESRDQTVHNETKVTRTTKTHKKMNRKPCNFN